MRRRSIHALVLGLVLVASGATAQTPVPTPARVLYPGGLDPTFGVGGFAPAPPDVLAVWAAVALQPDGKIVVTGDDGLTGRVVVARYTTGGELDASFGEAGIVIPVFANSGRATALTVTDRGEIVVVGDAQRVRNGPGIDAFALRLEADGSLDAAFGGGLVTFPLDSDGTAQAVVTQTSGRLVLLVQSNQPPPAEPAGAAVLLGVRRNGTLDPTFGSGGVARVDGDADERFELATMAEESGGRLLVSATAFTEATDENRVRIVRFDRNGHPLRSFDGFAGFATGIAVLAAGEVLVNGGFSDDTRGAYPAFVRFDADGSFDESFGDRGVLGAREDSPGKIVVDAQNRVLVAAEVLARHFSDGVLDESFGAGGFAAGSRWAAFHDVASQPDGGILAAGGAFSNPKGGGFGCLTSLARYESDRTQLCGDADASGAFTVSDGVATLRAAAGLDGPCTAAVCDVDGSGAIAVTDGVHVLRAAAGLSATLSCGIP